jgi:hypothetical protein
MASLEEHTPHKWTVKGDVQISGHFQLLHTEEQQSEIIFDYGRAVGGVPFIEISKVIGEDVQVDIIFSETHGGLSSETGMHYSLN